jgi:hypothetical protein
MSHINQSTQLYPPPKTKKVGQAKEYCAQHQIDPFELDWPLANRGLGWTLGHELVLKGLNPCRADNQEEIVKKWGRTRADCIIETMVRAHHLKPALDAVKAGIQPKEKGVPIIKQVMRWSEPYALDWPTFEALLKASPDLDVKDLSEQEGLEWLKRMPVSACVKWIVYGRERGRRWSYGEICALEKRHKLEAVRELKRADMTEEQREALRTKWLEMAKTRMSTNLIDLLSEEDFDKKEVLFSFLFTQKLNADKIRSCMRWARRHQVELTDGEIEQIVGRLVRSNQIAAVRALWIERPFEASKRVDGVPIGLPKTKPYECTRKSLPIPVALDWVTLCQPEWTQEEAQMVLTDYVRTCMPTEIIWEKLKKNIPSLEKTLPSVIGCNGLTGALAWQSFFERKKLLEGFSNGVAEKQRKTL